MDTNYRSEVNRGSKLLNSYENEIIFSLLGQNCYTLRTTVAQLLYSEPPTHSKWYIRCAGVVCFVNDNPKQSYFIRIYDLDKRRLVWEQKIDESFEYKTAKPFFHTFEVKNSRAALNFTDDDEAIEFGTTVLSLLWRRIMTRLDKANPKFVEFLEMAGVTREQLISTDTRNFIYDFINRNGGLLMGIKEMKTTGEEQLSEIPPIRPERGRKQKRLAPPPPYPRMLGKQPESFEVGEEEQISPLAQALQANRLKIQSSAAGTPDSAPPPPPPPIMSDQNEFENQVAIGKELRQAEEEKLPKPVVKKAGFNPSNVGMKYVDMADILSQRNKLKAPKKDYEGTKTYLERQKKQKESDNYKDPPAPTQHTKWAQQSPIDTKRYQKRNDSQVNANSGGNYQYYDPDWNAEDDTQG